VFLLVYPQTVDTSMCQECVGMWILVCAYCVCVYVCVCVCVCVCRAQIQESAWRVYVCDCVPN